MKYRHAKTTIQRTRFKIVLKFGIKDFKFGCRTSASLRFGLGMGRLVRNFGKTYSNSLILDLIIPFEFLLDMFC